MMHFNVWQRGIIIGHIGAASLADAARIAKKQFKSCILIRIGH